MTRKSTLEATPDLEEALAGRGRELVSSLVALLDHLPGRPRRPQEVARALSINKDLSSRVMGALRNPEPMGAIHALPGAAPLRNLARAASECGAPTELVERVLDAIEGFDAFVRSEFGARTQLQGWLSARLPGAREQVQASSKQAIFRGMSGLRGVSVENLLVTFLVHPSKEQPGRCDTAVVNGFFGIRRTRPGAHFSFSTLCESRTDDATGTDPVLHEFCHPDPLPVATERRGERLFFELIGDGFGRRDSTDLVTLEVYRGNHPLDPAGGDPRWFFAGVEHPTRELHFDVLIHRDVWPDRPPRLSVLEPGSEGEFRPSDPPPESSRMNLQEPLDRVEAPLLGARRIPRYAELVESVCAREGWDPQAFRAHRCETPYPVYACAYALVFPSEPRDR